MKIYDISMYDTKDYKIIQILFADIIVKIFRNQDINIFILI